VILAGDIGGTNTRLALFDGEVAEPIHLETYESGEYEGLEPMLQAFLSEHPAEVRQACFGVAGPVREGQTDVVNLAWPVDARRVADVLGLPAVGLINDLEANAYGIAALRPEDFAVLNEGDPEASGNAAVISAGTGLGEALLYWDGSGHYPIASEGGHADFAPRNDLEVELLRFLLRERGHVSWERVCSGMGLANIYRFLGGPDAHPAHISLAAIEGTDETASRALALFCSIYGAEAGNLALKVMATAGVYVGGGIAPKILPRLQDGGFMKAFIAKGRMRELLEAIPVRVILNDKTALLGAALYASSA
jgi:glucokinase